MEPTFSVLDCTHSPNLLDIISNISTASKGLNIIIHGPSYPNADANKPQTLNLDIFCDLESQNTEPTFTSYDGSELKLTWSSKAGCSVKADPGSGDGDSGGDNSGGDGDHTEPSASTGSGVGWFFLV
jgi:autophagy-related protein 27